MASSTSPETLVALPCSIQVYQETPTPARRATSSRRSPGVRRFLDVGSPTWAGVISARRAFRKLPSSTRGGEGVRRTAVFLATYWIVSVATCVVNGINPLSRGLSVVLLAGFRLVDEEGFLLGGSSRPHFGGGNVRGVAFSGGPKVFPRGNGFPRSAACRGGAADRGAVGRSASARVGR